jgi:2-dehydropantoate 2-reductase
MPPLSHAILGAGGVGGLIGACLAHSGDRVTLIVRAESLAEYPKKISLQSPFGNFATDVAVAATVPAVDVLWITVKANQLNSALVSVTDPTAVRAIVPLLNGIDHLALLRLSYGEKKIVAATIAVESERVGPGQIIQRSPFARLNVSSAGRDLLSPTVGQFEKLGFECKFVDDEPTLMWSKLVFLGPYALATTAANMSAGEAFGHPIWRELSLPCIREACAVAIAEGAKVDADAVIAMVTKMPRDMRSSMQKDVEQHKIPELDAIAGPILRGARHHGIEIPATRRLVSIVEQRANYPVSLLD